MYDLSADKKGPDESRYVDWWSDRHEGERHRVVCACVNDIQTNEGNRSVMDIQNAMLYGEHTVFGYEFKGVKNATRLTMNLIKSVVDTVVARVARNTPKPSFLTAAGNWSLKRKAKLMERFVTHTLEVGGAKRAIQEAFLDAAVLGSGAFQPVKEGTEIRFERVFPCELFVDPMDGMYGSPHNLYRRKWVNREYLSQKYSKKGEMIHMAQGPDPQHTPVGLDGDADLVTVVEAWHLGYQGKGGRHVICTSDGTLFEEPWKHDSFPVIFIHYSKGLFGFWGKGIAENLTGLQVELNKNLIKMQKILHLMAVPRVILDGNLTEGKGQTWNNSVGGVFRTTGQRPPFVYAPSTVPPELPGHIENMWNKGFQLEGISPIEASGAKPAGLTSGAALREYDDLLSGKFALTHQRYEQAWLDAAKWCLIFGKEISKSHPKWSVVAKKDKGSIQEIAWADVDMEKDEYVIALQAASSLPRTPAAKMAMVGDMFDKGWIDADKAKRLIDFSDLDQEQALDGAMTDYLDWVIEEMIDEGNQVVPEPFQDHQLALKRVTAAYHKAIVDQAPEQNLQLLRTFLAQTRDEMKKMQAEQAAMLAPASVGAPPATGFDGAPPTAVTPADGSIPS